MKFQKGKSGNPSGRRRGTKNRIGATAKENLTAVFEGLGGVDGMERWARKNLSDFYRLYARLVPVDQHHTGSIGTYEAIAIPVEERNPLEEGGDGKATSH